MPRRVDDIRQPERAPTAGDLGMEAYQANLDDTPGKDPTIGDTAGSVPPWKAPQAHNAPPGQHRKDAAEIKLGRDVKE
ncbi:MAG: hypothetical protein ACM3XM_09685 [Mycobacterium leprae]